MKLEIVVIGLILLVGLAGVLAWRRWKQHPAHQHWLETVTPEFRCRFEETRNRLLNMSNWEVQIRSSGKRELTAHDLARMASSAFGRSFSVREGEFDAIDAAFLASEEDGAQIAGTGPHFYLALAPHLFTVMDLCIQDGRLVTIRYTPSVGCVEELVHGYRWTAKLAAQFVEGSDVTVRLNATEFSSIEASAAAAALCAEDPLTALENLKNG